MSTITIEIPETLVSGINRIAERRRVAYTVIIRDALSRYIDATKADSPRSAYDAVKQFVPAQGGPPDLSTNPAYLEGYGLTQTSTFTAATAIA